MFLSRFFGRERKARQLNRDAVAVIEQARAGSPTERVRAAAIETGRCLREAHERGGDDPSLYGPIVEHFKIQHHEARRRGDDASLTALTLVIIYIRAEMLGTGAEPARSAIDALVAEWAHAHDTEARLEA